MLYLGFYRAMWFSLVQWLKDLIAVVLFCLLANMPLFLSTPSALCLFFSFGCLLDTVFCCVRYWNDYVLTVAAVKDMLGAVWMGIFTFMLAFGILTNEQWGLFFYTAAVIDYLSTFSILTPYNIYCVIIPSLHRRSHSLHH